MVYSLIKSYPIPYSAYYNLVTRSFYSVSFVSRVAKAELSGSSQCKLVDNVCCMNCCSNGAATLTVDFAMAASHNGVPITVLNNFSFKICDLVSRLFYDKS
jgi:hypothetical protein